MAVGSLSSPQEAESTGQPRIAWSVLAACLSIAPIGALILAALLASDSGETLRLATTRLAAYVSASLALAALVAAGTVLLGGGLAWLVATYRFPGRDFFDWALMMPLAVPAYVLAYAYLDMTTAAGPLQTFMRETTGWRVGDYWFPEVSGLSGAAFVFSIGLYPYVYAIARRSFEGQAALLLEAGRTLGCSRWRAFRDISFPLARPALIAGVALALMETLADYGAVAHLGVPTFTYGILRAWSAAGEPIAAARLAVLLLVFCVALLIVERRQRGRAGFALTRNGRKQAPEKLQGAAAWAATGLCGLVLAIGLIIPALYLGSLAIAQTTDADRAIAAALRSVGLALSAALLITLMAYGLASRARLGSRLADRMRDWAASGYAVPGAAAALGVLMLVGAVRSAAPFAWMLPVAGVPLLLLAYQTRFAAAAIGPIRSAFDAMPRQWDAAARTLGCNAGAVARRIHLPVLAPSLVTAALLVFVEVVKELPATMILRPFNFDTLAVIAHAYAADERLGQAALPAFLIVAICTPVMAWATYSINRARR